MDEIAGDETASPCVAICAYDAGAGVCTGCGRTLDEIAAWPSASPGRKRAIRAAIAARAASNRHVTG